MGARIHDDLDRADVVAERIRPERRFRDRLAIDQHAEVDLAVRMTGPYPDRAICDQAEQDLVSELAFREREADSVEGRLGRCPHVSGCGRT